MQQIWKAEEIVEKLNTLIQQKQIYHILFVCGHSFQKQDMWQIFKNRDDIVLFQDFEPNPSYESVVKGVELFHQKDCNMIIAAGGGSAMDVAKCIKLYWNLDRTKNYLEQKIMSNTIPFMAIPTTAGTGSEATSFAVIYYQGVKQSVSHESCIPEYVLMDGTLLNSLPAYQRKVTMMDALCHGIESYWSINSTEESTLYSRNAIKGVVDNLDLYLSNDGNGNEAMLEAAHIAGKAINITKTTAAHAMCYQLTKLYHIPHGYSAMLCLIPLWDYMNKNMDRCIDSRGKEFLQARFLEISRLLGCKSVDEAILFLKDWMTEMSICGGQTIHEEHINKLVESVNLDRLRNNPVLLDKKAIEGIYKSIII